MHRHPVTQPCAEIQLVAKEDKMTSRDLRKPLPLDGSGTKSTAERPGNPELNELGGLENPGYLRHQRDALVLYTDALGELLWPTPDRIDGAIHHRRMS
jgi:hypothetical protein